MKTSRLLGAVIIIYSSHISAALVSIGEGAFSGSQTILDFEDTLGGTALLPAGYGSSSGVTFSSTTRSFAYSDYLAPSGGEPTLSSVATLAGLGDLAATWGGDNGTYGTGFNLTASQTRVGFYVSSNTQINTTIYALLNGVILGSELISLAPSEIGFVGFEDATGIDQIIIGDNTSCPSCIHQLDNVMFESAVAPIPASVWLFGSGLLGLIGIARRKKA